MTCSLTDEQRKGGLLCRSMTCEECKKYREDIINKPSHYNIGKIQASDYIADQQLDYFDGNVIKYISRARFKGSEESDKKKALWYIIRGLIKAIGKDNALTAVELTLKHFREDDEIPNTHSVKVCQESFFHGTGCLENEEQFGFFKSDEDIRPSSCMWIDKDKAGCMR